VARLVGVLQVGEDKVGVKVRWKNKLILGTAIVALGGSLICGQQATETKRRVKTKVNPAYPDLAIKMKVSGKVKVEVVIAPDGHVKSTRAVGGHPLLVQTCLDAVKDWRFEGTPEESTEIIEFTFNR